MGVFTFESVTEVWISDEYLMSKLIKRAQKVLFSFEKKYFLSKFL